MRAWRSSTHAAVLEQQMRILRQRLEDTEEIVNMQSALSVKEPSSFAYKLALLSLKLRRESIQREMADVFRQREREVVHLALEGNRFQDNGAYLSDLSHILFRAQKVFTSIVQAVSVGPTQRGRIPAAIERLAQLRLQTTYPSSFGMVLEAETATDMFGNSEVITALDAFFALLQSSNDRDQLIDRSGNLGSRVFSHYRSFVNQLERTGTSITISWSDPIGYVYRWEAREPELARLSINLESIKTESSQTYNVYGWLLGASLLRNRFELLVENNGSPISGRIAKEAKNAVQELFGQQCIARITENQIFDEISDSIKSVFTLVALIPVNQSMNTEVE